MASQDEGVRAKLKEYSNWPTYPQLYVKGELLGGCDIIMEMKVCTHAFHLHSVMVSVRASLSRSDGNTTPATTCEALACVRWQC